MATKTTTGFRAEAIRMVAQASEESGLHGEARTPPDRATCQRASGDDRFSLPLVTIGHK